MYPKPINVYVNDRPVPVSTEDFGKYRSVIIDGINAQIKYVYNRAKEKFMAPVSTEIRIGSYTVKTNLKGGLKFDPSGEVYIDDPAFLEALRSLFNDIAALMLIYHRTDEFLSMLQTPELWALLVFVAADEELTDMFTQAELEFFNSTWKKTGNTKEVEMRESIIEMLLALRNGQSYDLSRLKLYDDQGKPVKLTGKLEPY